MACSRWEDGEAGTASDDEEELEDSEDVRGLRDGAAARGAVGFADERWMLPAPPRPVIIFADVGGGVSFDREAGPAAEGPTVSVDVL